MQIWQQWLGDPGEGLTGEAESLTTFQIPGFVSDDPELCTVHVEVSPKT